MFTNEGLRFGGKKFVGPKLHRGIQQLCYLLAFIHDVSLLDIILSYYFYSV